MRMPAGFCSLLMSMWLGLVAPIFVGPVLAGAIDQESLLRQATSLQKHAGNPVLDVGRQENELGAARRGFGEFDEASVAEALAKRPFEPAGPRAGSQPVPADMPDQQAGADVAANDVAKRRGDVPLPIREIRPFEAEVQHAMGKKPGKNAAAGHARYLGRLLQDAEFVQASQNAEME